MQTPPPALSVHGAGVLSSAGEKPRTPCLQQGGLNSKATAQTLENPPFTYYRVFGGYDMIIQQGRHVLLITALLF